MSSARLRLAELMRRSRNDARGQISQGLRQTAQGAGQFDQLSRRKRKDDLDAAVLIAEGFLKGDNTEPLPTFDGTGSIPGSTESPQTALERFRQAVKQRSPGFAEALGDDALTGILSSRRQRVDPLLGGKRDLLSAKLRTEQARAGGIDASTVDKRAATFARNKKTDAESVDRATGSLRVGAIDSDVLSSTIKEKTDELMALAPNLSREEVEGQVAAKVYTSVDEARKKQVAKEKADYARAESLRRFEIQSDRAEKRAMTTADMSILSDKADALDMLSDLGEYAQKPSIKNKWKQYSIGANELAKVTGQYINGFMELGNYELAQQKLGARIKGDADYLEFLRRTKKAIFIIGRANNGPGVMTEGDLAFWSDALMSSTSSPEEFKNSVNREMETIERKYINETKDYQQLVHRVPDRHTKYAEAGARFGGKAISPGGVAPRSSDVLLGVDSARGLSETIGKMFSVFDPMALLFPGASGLTSMFGGNRSTPGESSGGVSNEDLPKGVRTPLDAKSAMDGVKGNLRRAIASFGNDSEEAHKAARMLSAVRSLSTGKTLKTLTPGLRKRNEKSIKTTNTFAKTKEQAMILRNQARLEVERFKKMSHDHELSESETVDFLRSVQNLKNAKIQLDGFK